MGLTENPISNQKAQESPQDPPQEPVIIDDNTEEEVPFQPTDQFWKDTSFHGSDKQLVAGVILHVGHQVASEAKEGLKSGIKKLFGLW